MFLKRAKNVGKGYSVMIGRSDLRTVLALTDAKHRSLAHVPSYQCEQKHTNFLDFLQSIHRPSTLICSAVLFQLRRANRRMVAILFISNETLADETLSLTPTTVSSYKKLVRRYITLRI